MVEAITATYAEHDDDWSVTVTGLGEELTERAPGIIAARDQADQLIESLKPADADSDGETVVVHLLNGSALEFTTAYMTARLSRTSDPSTADGALEGAHSDHPDQATEDSGPDHPIPAQATSRDDSEQAETTDSPGQDNAAESETEGDAEPAASSAK